MSLQVVPCTIRDACAFVAQHHRHHRPPQGALFAVAVADENERLTVERMNDLFIHERRLYEDCFTKRRLEFAA